MPYQHVVHFAPDQAGSTRPRPSIPCPVSAPFPPPPHLHEHLHRGMQLQSRLAHALRRLPPVVGVGAVVGVVPRARPCPAPRQQEARPQAAAAAARPALRGSVRVRLLVAVRRRPRPGAAAPAASQTHVHMVAMARGAEGPEVVTSNAAAAPLVQGHALPRRCAAKLRAAACRVTLPQHGMAGSQELPLAPPHAAPGAAGPILLPDPRPFLPSSPPPGPHLNAGCTAVAAAAKRSTRRVSASVSVSASPSCAHSASQPSNSTMAFRQRHRPGKGRGG